MAGIVSNDDIRGAQSRLTIEEGNELLAGALGAKGKGDRGEAVDGIETKQDIIMLGELLARPEIAADASWELGRGGVVGGRDGGSSRLGDFRRRGGRGRAAQLCTFSSSISTAMG